MFAQPYMGAMPPDGAYNPGYGAPSAGSMSSIPRSQKSRHTYAPTEPAESVRGGSVGRQSRFDQYKAQRLPEKVPMTSDRSPEREGGTTYYRYQYNGEGKNTSHHGSQASLGSARDRHQPPSYQAARFHRQTPPQPSATELYGSQGSLGGRQPYQPQHHASQGSLGDVNLTSLSTTLAREV
ncbi:hypothetical protein EB796_012839 [Bugula neritina]|uniref:Uncharacterized protein n=1 Tax=Bugula neritina TaxID=10212 RepID=A0A7J7JT65_BUGNE|nr:hypothetical protein EB796_012839 [Bugula neritina]